MNKISTASSSNTHLANKSINYYDKQSQNSEFDVLLNEKCEIINKFHSQQMKNNNDNYINVPPNNDSNKKQNIREMNEIFFFNNNKESNNNEINNIFSASSCLIKNEIDHIYCDVNKEDGNSNGLNQINVNKIKQKTQNGKKVENDNEVDISIKNINLNKKEMINENQQKIFNDSGDENLQMSMNDDCDYEDNDDKNYVNSNSNEDPDINNHQLDNKDKKSDFLLINNTKKIKSYENKFKNLKILAMKKEQDIIQVHKTQENSDIYTNNKVTCKQVSKTNSSNSSCSSGIASYNGNVNEHFFDDDDDSHENSEIVNRNDDEKNIDKQTKDLNYNKSKRKYSLSMANQIRLLNEPFHNEKKMNDDNKDDEESRNVLNNVIEGEVDENEINQTNLSIYENKRFTVYSSSLSDESNLVIIKKSEKEYESNKEKNKEESKKNFKKKYNILSKICFNRRKKKLKSSKFANFSHKKKQFSNSNIEKTKLNVNKFEHESSLSTSLHQSESSFLSNMTFDFKNYLIRTISEILTSQLTLTRKVDFIQKNFSHINKKLKEIEINVSKENKIFKNLSTGSLNFQENVQIKIDDENKESIKNIINNDKDEMLESLSSMSTLSSSSSRHSSASKHKKIKSKDRLKDSFLKIKAENSISPLRKFSFSYGDFQSNFLEKQLLDEKVIPLNTQNKISQNEISKSTEHHSNNNGDQKKSHFHFTANITKKNTLLSPLIMKSQTPLTKCNSAPPPANMFAAHKINSSNADLNYQKSICLQNSSNLIHKLVENHSNNNMNDHLLVNKISPESTQSEDKTSIKNNSDGQQMLMASSSRRLVASISARSYEQEIMNSLKKQQTHSSSSNINFATAYHQHRHNITQQSLHPHSQQQLDSKISNCSQIKQHQQLHSPYPIFNPHLQANIYSQQHHYLNHEQIAVHQNRHISIPNFSATNNSSQSSNQSASSLNPNSGSAIHNTTLINATNSNINTTTTNTCVSKTSITSTATNNNNINNNDNNNNNNSSINSCNNNNNNNHSYILSQQQMPLNAQQTNFLNHHPYEQHQKQFSDHQNNNKTSAALVAAAAFAAALAKATPNSAVGTTASPGTIQSLQANNIQHHRHHSNSIDGKDITRHDTNNIKNYPIGNGKGIINKDQGEFDDSAGEDENFFYNHHQQQANTSNFSLLHNCHSSIRHIPSSTIDQLELSEEIESLVSRDVIKRCIRKAKHRGNFAANLTAELFTKEERITCNCTGTRGKRQLSPRRLQIVKEITFRVYNSNAATAAVLAAAASGNSSSAVAVANSAYQDFEEAWRKECITAIDAKNRSIGRDVIKITTTITNNGGSNTNSNISGNINESIPSPYSNSNSNHQNETSD